MPKFFYEIFDPSLPRLGPGDDASTIRALDAIRAAGLDSSRGLRVLDVGCGNGTQTLQLATALPEAAIVALDSYLPFLEELDRRAAAAGVGERIKTVLGDMNEMPFEENSFELIWSEGALFVMGWAAGLTACRRLLVPGGFMAATDMCWFRSDVPEECRAFFAEVHPALTDLPGMLAGVESSGFELLTHFALPPSAWLESYYGPLGERLRMLRESTVDAEDRQLIDAMQHEKDIYYKYGSYYGYEFFVMRR
jgi:SAM-dependent methyltransferase